MESSFDCSNEPSGSISCLEIFEYMIYWLLLKKGSTPRVNQANQQARNLFRIQVIIFNNVNVSLACNFMNARF
jgi:hypothetical protein